MHVLNCIDGCIPSDMATGKADDIEEERRLLYVAMTRARDHLTLLLPHRFYVRQQSGTGDRHVYAVRSRFLTDDVCRHFDQDAWPVAAHEPGRTAPEAGVVIDVGARLRAAWSQPGSQSILRK